MAVVSAIITCMTDAEQPFIRDALISVRDQSEPCDVILLVTDSNGWIERIAAGFDDIRIVRQPLAPLGAVRNAGVRLAGTEYVAFLDGDDVWLPSKTARQLALLRAQGGSFVGTDHLLTTEAGCVFAYALARYLPMPSTWMVRRDFMLRHPFTE